MAVSFEINAESRADRGTNASRRLRRQGRIPAVLYGGDGEPEALSLEHREVLRHLDKEAFYSQVLQVNIGSRKERAVLRGLQRHHYKPAVLHMDLQRITEDENVRVHIPLHFINQETAVGVKQQGGTVSHQRIEVEITCLPKDLPEFIEVDLKDLSIGENIYLSGLKLPEGVEIPELTQGPEYDVAVVSIHSLKGGSTADSEEEPEASV
jgi:large subunit ribosomal protein L25